MPPKGLTCRGFYFREFTVRISKQYRSTKHIRSYKNMDSYQPSPRYKLVAELLFLLSVS